MNIKFPKEEIVIVEKIRSSLIEKNINDLIELTPELLNHANFISQYYNNIIDVFIETLFEYRLFEKVISLVEELRKKDLESCTWYYYAFACLIANKDFYYAKSIISKSKLLNDKSIAYLIDVEDGNYNAVFNLHNELIETIGPCLIIINFINELFNESINKSLTDEYIVMRFFDLLNLLFEYGIEEEVIEKFETVIEIIYEIPIY